MLVKKIRICAIEEVQVFVEMKKCVVYKFVKCGSKIPCGVQQSETILPAPRVTCSCNSSHGVTSQWTCGVAVPSCVMRSAV